MVDVDRVGTVSLRSTSGVRPAFSKLPSHRWANIASIIIQCHLRRTRVSLETNLRSTKRDITVNARVNEENGVKTMEKTKHT